MKKVRYPGERESSLLCGVQRDLGFPLQSGWGVCALSPCRSSHSNWSAHEEAGTLQLHTGHADAQLVSTEQKSRRRKSGQGEERKKRGEKKQKKRRKRRRIHTTEIQTEA